MNADPALFLDLVFTVASSVALAGGGVLALWLLPWSDQDRAGTTRAMVAMVAKTVDAARPRGAFPIGPAIGRTARAR